MEKNKKETTKKQAEESNARAFVKKVGPDFNPPYKDCLGDYNLSAAEREHAYRTLNSMAAERARAIARVR